jgi:hypothetical protein
MIVPRVPATTMASKTRIISVGMEAAAREPDATIVRRSPNRQSRITWLLGAGWMMRTGNPRSSADKKIS